MKIFWFPVSQRTTATSIAADAIALSFRLLQPTAVCSMGAAANTAGLGGNTGNARQNQQQLCILPEIAAGQGKNDGHFHLLTAYTIPKLIGPTQLVLPKVPF